jgi:hypothetical protein
VARSTDNGATWTAPAALNTNAATDSGSDDIPQVTTDDAGNWVTVWHSRDDLGGTIGDDWDILVARSTDNGASWTDPVALNTNAATDSDADADRYPQVTTEGAGNWVAVWGSTVNLGGTIGDDYDILYATCSPLDADCPGADDDGDGVADAADNCPEVPNADQTNTDGDEWGNACDSDDDNDGFDDTIEAYLGTDPLDDCPDDPSDDAWPPDINMDTEVNVLDMFRFVLADVLATELGDPNFNARFDLNADQSINVLDLFQYVVLDVLATECTNP